MSVNSSAFGRPRIIATWVDDQIGKSETHHSMKKQFVTLSKLITEWKFFDTHHAFYDDLDTYPKTKILLITSGAFGRHIVPEKHELTQIYRIYIFCHDVESNEKWSDEYNKVSGVFNIEDLVYKQLADDLATLFRDEGEAYRRSSEYGLARLNYKEAKHILIKVLKLSDKDDRVQFINDELETVDLHKCTIN
ncbi:unnamed protein product [Didymodactylos carnosus]|uniref:Uncharacterized protein n=1 Tax=Didymodactylos carnosus TaxID=1234261 RepID=A0A814D6C2_9BILA|nr:unnamed protein product [Didymodactylos carnosus]CAF0993224.1 unnamed protein product [Didymodactylos carnosus]CAF3725692.1 unnamed protein product [Didymodactylos carnosus]CAF3763110.1 unnamed protein product [Didymodactylos carnosus]